MRKSRGRGLENMHIGTEVKDVGTVDGEEPWREAGIVDPGGEVQAARYDVEQSRSSSDTIVPVHCMCELCGSAHRPSSMMRWAHVSCRCTR